MGKPKGYNKLEVISDFADADKLKSGFTKGEVQTIADAKGRFKGYIVTIQNPDGTENVRDRNRRWWCELGVYRLEYAKQNPGV